MSVSTATSRLLDQTHGDTGHRRLHWHTGVHQSQAAPQTEAMELEPLDSVISDTTRMVYGNTSAAGSMA
jgi:hypothetical protein